MGALFRSCAAVVAVTVAMLLSSCGSDDGGDLNNNAPASCGNGVAEAPEECDQMDLGANSCQSFGFYTGVLACLADCTLTTESCEHAPVCGNGVLETGEVCDDGNTAEGDGCNPICLHEVCGNGYIDVGEVCDDGNASGGDGCDANCLSDERCGNGVLDDGVGEECDDGNLRSHDGCSSGCTQESPEWVDRTYFISPPARYAHAMIYDHHRKRTVVFGGSDGGGTLFDDTWEHDGVSQGWAQVTWNPSPPGRWDHAMVYDEDTQRVILFGGHSSTVRLNDTWTYNSPIWQQVVTTGSPTPLMSHGMVYDPLRGLSVLFGGEYIMAMMSGDTWEYDSANITWTLATPSAAPAPRLMWQGLAFDAARGAVALFGGRQSPNHLVFDDYWVYDGLQWQSPQFLIHPPERFHHGLVYDPRRERTVLFGGTSNSLGVLNDTWEWDGISWTETSPAGAPHLRRFGMVYERSHGRIVLFGGQDDMDNPVDERWIYQYTSGWPDEDCSSGVDDDADGLVDCADPDCDGNWCNGGECIAGSCQ